MKMYFGGIPTAPDVDRIIEQYPIDKLEPGMQITYQTIAGIINQDIKSYRWKTVTSAWRKKIESDYNIIIDPDELEPETFVVLFEGGKVRLSRKKLRTSGRIARRSYEISARVDVKKLSDDEKKNHDFNVYKAAAVIASAQLRSKQPSLPTLQP
jgi:hypothetical protein